MILALREEKTKDEEEEEEEEKSACGIAEWEGGEGCSAGMMDPPRPRMDGNR